VSFCWMVNVGPDTAMRCSLVRSDPGRLGIMVWAAWNAADPHRATWAIYRTIEYMNPPRVAPEGDGDSWGEAEPLCHGFVERDGEMAWWDTGEGMYAGSQGDLADLHAALCEARALGLQMLQEQSVKCRTCDNAVSNAMCVGVQCYACGM